MNLFKEIIITAPVNNRLKFGYNDNLQITKIFTGIKTNKGLPLKQNTFITIAQIDPTTNKITAQSESSYWNLDHTSDFIITNFIDQFTSLASMIDATGGNVENFQEDVLSVVPEEVEDFDTYLATKNGSIEMQKSLIASAGKHLNDIVGNDCPLLKGKIITNKKGFFELGREINWVLPMTSEDELAIITAGDKKAYRESLKADIETPKKPDTVGEKPVTNSTFPGL